jgi:hypothetical protein
MATAHAPIRPRFPNPAENSAFNVCRWLISRDAAWSNSIVLDCVTRLLTDERNGVQ